MPVRLLVVPRDRRSTVSAAALRGVLEAHGVVGGAFPATDPHACRFGAGPTPAFEEPAEAATLAVSSSSGSEPFLCLRSESIEEVPAICGCGATLWRSGDGDYDYVLRACPACGSPFDPHLEVATARDPWTNELIEVAGGTCHGIGLELELDHVPEERPALDGALQEALERVLGPIDAVWLA